jgi:hypothetical protein
MNDAGFLIPNGTKGAYAGAKHNYIIRAQDMFEYLSKNYNLNSSSKTGEIVKNAIIAQSQDGSHIGHVDIVFNRKAGNYNYYHWQKHYIFR